MQRTLLMLTILTSLTFSQNIPFKVGEKLSYTLQFNVVKMGRGYLTVESIEDIAGVESFHVQFEAKTRKFADRIFRVRDKIDIWLNKSDLTTLKINKQINEGGYHKNYYTYVDYANSLAIINQDTINVENDVRDPYSLLYYLRTIPLKVGQVLEFTTLDNKKISDFQIIVEGKETINTPAGKFSCIIMQPFREGEALLKNEGDMTIWFSDDELRLPIQIKIKLKFGSMLLQLRDINL